MAVRTVLVSRELFLVVLQGFRDGPPRYFDVIADPIPADAQLIRIGYSSETRCVEMTLKSASWDGSKPQQICPMLRYVEMPKSEAPNGG